MDFGVWLSDAKMVNGWIITKAGRIPNLSASLLTNSSLGLGKVAICDAS
jgi:hypothetical protein